MSDAIEVSIVREEGETFTCVEWTFRNVDFHPNNDRNTGFAIETCVLTPHNGGECDCADDLHPKQFRLKMYPDGNSCGFNMKALYVNCNPHVPIKCKFSRTIANNQFTRENDNCRELGWQYLTTLFCRKPQYKLVLNLYIDKNVKPIVAIPTPEQNLCTDLLDLLIEGSYSDVSFVSEDGKVFKAHRGILAKRCEMFRAMFDHDHTEAGAEIQTTLNQNVLKAILTFIYTGVLPKATEVTAQLYIAADFYQLAELKTECISAMFSQLTVENAIQTLELADQYGNTDLLNHTLRFIKDGHMQELIDTDGYKNLKSIDLLKIIFEFVARS